MAAPRAVRLGERAASHRLTQQLAALNPACNATGPAPTSIEAFASLPRLSVVTRCSTEHFHPDSAHGRPADTSHGLSIPILGARVPPCYRPRRRVHDDLLAPTRRTLR